MDGPHLSVSPDAIIEPLAGVWLINGDDLQYRTTWIAAKHVESTPRTGVPQNEAARAILVIRVILNDLNVTHQGFF